MRPIARLWDLSQDIFKAIFPDWIQVLFGGLPYARLVHVNHGTKLTVSMLEAPSKIAKKAILADVVLPTDLFLARQLALPPVSDRNLRSMAALDLTRKTPFLASEVLWTLIPSPPNQTGTHIQYVSKSKDLELYRVNLDTHGIKVRRFLLANGRHYNVVTDFVSQIAPRRKLILATNLVFACLTIICLLVGSMHPAQIARSEIDDLRLENMGLQAQALKLRQELDEIEEVAEEENSFLKALTNRRRAADDLREVTVALPDATWVSDLTISNDRILISGETSGSAAELILHIANSPLRLEPSLNGAVSRTNEGRERFSLVLSKVNR